MIIEVSPKDFVASWTNIAAGRGGKMDAYVVFMWFQKQLLGVATSDDPGTLQRDYGRRSSYSELIGLMSEGISEITSDGSVHPGCRPITFTLRVGVNTDAKPDRREFLRKQLDAERRGDTEHTAI